MTKKKAFADISRAPKLARNMEIARDALNGATYSFLAKKHKISIVTARDALKMAIRNCAPGYQDLPLTELRLHKDDLLRFLRGDDGADEIEPMVKFEEAARGLGLNPLATRRLAERMLKVQPKDLDLTDVTPKDLENLLTEKIVMALTYMDDVTFAKATLKDLSAAVGVLIDRRQLMRGEPTQILSNTDRKSMDELFKRVVQVAQKRGMTVDLDESQFQKVN